MLALIALIIFIILMLAWAGFGVHGMRAQPGTPFPAGMAIAWWCVLILALFVFGAFGSVNFGPQARF